MPVRLRALVELVREMRVDERELFGPNWCGWLPVELSAKTRTANQEAVSGRKCPGSTKVHAAQCAEYESGYKSSTVFAILQIANSYLIALNIRII